MLFARSNTDHQDFCWKILIPYYQNSMSCFLVNIDVIFMFSGRYRSHVQDDHEIVKRILIISRPPSFPQFAKNEIWKCEIYNNSLFENVSRKFLELQRDLVYIYGFPKAQNSRNHEMWIFQSFR